MPTPSAPSFDPFTQTLMTLLMGSPAIRASIGKSLGGEAQVAEPRQPISPEEGDAELPSGTFTPQRAPDAPAVAPAQDQGPLSRILGLSPETTQTMRTIGGGLANVHGNPYGDPFITFAQGFGGAQATAQDREDKTAAANAAASKLAYDRQVADQERQRQSAKDAADLELRRLAERRAQRTADSAERKTDMEIRKLARANGITNEQMLKIEQNAINAADGVYDQEKRRQIIDESRQKQIDALRNNNDGLSDGPGVSGGGDAQVYENADGQRISWDGKQWVDVDTGEPYQQGQ